jgi:diguanylate cyclase (GGDEF)-like protein
MYDRRTEDRLTARMLYLRPGGAGRGSERRQWRELRRDEGGERAVDSRLAFERLSGADSQLLLLDLQDDGIWLMLGGAMARLPASPPASPHLHDRAGREAAAWLRRNLSRWQRLELPTHLIGYTQSLAAADTPAAVCYALTEACLRIFGGYQAFVFEQPTPGAPLRAVLRPGLPPSVEVLQLDPATELGSVGALLGHDARLAPGAPLAQLRVFFEQPGVGLLVHAPVGYERVLFLTERRGDRTISVEEWQILNLLTEQADGAFKRMRLFDEVRSLSLTDELTGLANRRHMRLVLGPAFSAAQRGAPLTVLLLDLDDFKQVNDRDGHLAGDRLLRQVARCLARQGRGSDLVVRFGGDEFLVIFPGGTRASAETFADRVHAELEPLVRFSCGVAEFATETTRNAEDLIGEADRELYRSKRARGVGVGADPLEFVAG